MNKLLKLLILVFIFLVGYTCARMKFDPQMRLILHENGKLSFCELNENDRLYLCPKSRVAQSVLDGAIVFYQCNNKEAYIQTINLSNLAQAQLLSKLKSIPGEIKLECRTDTGDIFYLKDTMVYK